MRAGPRPPRTEAARGSPRRCGHAAVSPARLACFGKQRCCGFFLRKTYAPSSRHRTGGWTTARPGRRSVPSAATARAACSGVRPRRGPAPRPPATLSTGVPVAGGFSAHTHTRAHHSPLRVCLSRPFHHVDAPGAGSFHPVVLAVPCDPQFSRELHCPRYLQPVLGASLVDAGSPDTQLGVRVPCPQGCRSTGRCGP